MDAQTLYSRTRAETESLCRNAAQANACVLPSPPGGGPDALAQVAIGAKLIVDPRDESVARHLCALGIWEWWVSKAVVRALRPGMVCVDIGANAGYFTALMFQGGASQVLAIEPLPDLVRRLRASRVINLWDTRLKIIAGASGAQHGELEVCAPDESNLGGTFVRPVGAAGEIPATARVPVAPLDDQIREQFGPDSPVDLIKIDAEGSEPEIWEGMRETMARNPECHVFAELFGRPDCVAWLERLWSEGWVPMRIGYDGEESPVHPEDLSPSDVLMIHLHRGIKG